MRYSNIGVQKDVRVLILNVAAGTALIEIDSQQLEIPTSQLSQQQIVDFLPLCRIIFRNEQCDAQVDENSPEVLLEQQKLQTDQKPGESVTSETQNMVFDLLFKQPVDKYRSLYTFSQSIFDVTGLINGLAEKYGVKNVALL